MEYPESPKFIPVSASLVLGLHTQSIHHTQIPPSPLPQRAGVLTQVLMLKWQALNQQSCFLTPGRNFSKEGGGEGRGKKKKRKEKEKEEEKSNSNCRPAE